VTLVQIYQSNTNYWFNINSVYKSNRQGSSDWGGMLNIIGSIFDKYIFFLFLRTYAEVLQSWQPRWISNHVSEKIQKKLFKEKFTIAHVFWIS